MYAYVNLLMKSSSSSRLFKSYFYAQNTLIEESFSILDKQRPNS